MMSERDCAAMMTYINGRYEKNAIVQRIAAMFAWQACFEYQRQQYEQAEREILRGRPIDEDDLADEFRKNNSYLFDPLINRVQNEQVTPEKPT